MKKLKKMGPGGPQLFPAPSLAFQNAVQENLRFPTIEEILKRNEPAPSRNQPPVYSGLGPTKRVAISNSDNTRVQAPVKKLTYDQFKSGQDAVKVREQQGKDELARRYALRKAGINDLKNGKLTDNVFNAIQELPHLFSDNPFNHFDDINPLYLASKPVGSVGKRMLDPYNRILRDPIGSAFDAADMALLKGVGQFATPYLKAGLGQARNEVLARTLSSQMNRGIKNFKPELPGLTYGKRIDPINRSSVNVKNDFIREYGTQNYDDFLNNIYNKSAFAYDAPLIEFKGSRPTSFLSNLGSGTAKESNLFKEKFCAPGSECAKTANAVTNGMYTDITNKPFDALGNAHNAWHMEEQMLRNGGLNVTGQPMKIGDRLLMGNGVNQSTYVPGYTADPRIRHAGVFAGMQETKDGLLPMVFESGKNNPLYFNPVFETFTGPNTVIESIRPQQFLDNTFGNSLVDKNIRYAYRNKPSVAAYSSSNPNVQNLLNGAEDFRETIKRTHDITNDEFDELLNNLVSIGGQETKLNGLLPGSNLSKAKIQLQNKLNEVGLLKPIKQGLNSTKKVLNAVTTKPSNLPKYPGSSKLEMEAAIFSSRNNIPFEEALAKIKSNYQPKPKFSSSTVEPSKGMFRQKYQTQTDRLSNFGNELKSSNSLENGLGQMAENYNKIRKMYPNASPRELMDLTTLMWNSPGKAMDKNLVDFYMFGKNNPNPARFNFDYINKVNKYRDRYIDIKPNSVDPHFEYVRNGYYPEIQYNMGGGIELSNRRFEEGGPYEPETPTNWVEPKYVAGTNKDGHTGYNGVDTIYYDPNSEWENINNPQWLEHEKYHHFQNLNGRSHVGDSMQRPGPNASNEEMAAYYNRRDFDLQNSMNNMVNQSPELQFVPQEILQRGVYQNQNHIPGYEDLMYQDPNTLEGEARQYEDYIGAGNKSIFTPQYSKGGDIKNKAKLNAVINKMAVDNFDWNSKSLPEVQQYLNTIKSPEIKAIVKELNLLNPKNLSSILGVQNNPMNTMLDYGY